MNCKDADKCLKLDSTYTKAYFRRGVARMNLVRDIKDIEKAESDFNTVLKRQKNDKPSQQYLQRYLKYSTIITQIGTLHQKSRFQWGRYFSATFKYKGVNHLLFVFFLKECFSAYFVSP